MKLIYTRSVTKDVRKIKDENLKKWTHLVIENLKKATSLNEIRGIKKIKGHPLAFRIRLGDYRLAIYYKNEEVTLVRFLKRNDIYKVFPD